MTMHQPPESGRRRAGVSILALTPHRSAARGADLGRAGIRRRPDGDVGTDDESRRPRPADSRPVREDVLFYPPTGEMFVLEGSDDDVHRLAPGANGVFDGVPPVGDDTAVEFDTLNFGADDPEGITYHPTRGALLIVDFQTNRVYELNRELMLINVIVLAPAQ